ncbi:MAG: two-component system NarL family sensor kinase [Roseivirga sp.]|jgi:two-component system NarL family sensor kinase
MGLKLLFIIILSWGHFIPQQVNPLEEMRARGERMRAESKYDSALVLFREVERQALIDGNIEFQIRAAIGAAAVFFELRETQVARNYYYKAIKLSKITGNKRLENNAWYGIGGSYQLDGNLDSAIYYYDKTIVLFEEQGNKEMVTSLLSNLVTLYNDTEQYELAIQKGKEVIEIDIEMGNQRFIGIDERILGITYFKLESFDSANFHMTRAYEIAKSLGFKDDARLALNDLAEFAKKREDYKMAYEYRVKSDSIAQKIFVEGTNDEILDLREKYNTASLELENERQKNIAEQQRKSKFIILVVAVALILIISVWLYIVNQRRKNMTLLAEKNEEINKQQIDELLQEQEIASLQGVLQGQESERKRVAMDLHDRLGGMLSMVKLHFSAFEERIDTTDAKNQKFLKASELLDQATKEVREISHDLLSGVLTKFGLIPALEELKDKISSTGKLKVGIYSNDIKGALNAEQELQLYRIVQELLSNILKHAKAKETNIQLNRSGDSLNLIVEDDGVGFNLSNSNEKGGIGLINLKARVAKLNGSFHIDSGKGGGTTISIDIPLNND